jgi:single-stranded DNA-specific DHH superfamily exonuclease
MNRNMTVVLLLVLAGGCSTNPQDGAYPPPMDPTRKISVQICTRQVDTGDGGNLLCRDETEADRRARIAEEERQARAKKEAAERAERERLERERAEQLAREEAARAAAAAEAARLAAERQRQEEEAARKAQEERELQERLAAEALARQRAEQEAREAAARECRRLEQERSDGRAMLADFVAKYGQADEFKEIAGQISAFLDKAPKAKPCPPAEATGAAPSGEPPK